MLDIVELSRLQFALTAMYHFLFVPLTLGMAFLLAIMETVYVLSGKQIYKDMTKFWGKLFGINFALGVATGLTMEFQFGTNWSYYSHYVGDIFGAPLAIEGLMAFFLESTFVGLFFFGWDRLGKVQHMAVTWLVLGLLPRKMRQSCRSQLSLATCSTVMLGTLLVSSNQNYTLEQSIAFGLGSGLGYTFIVFIVREGRRRLRSKAVPAIFQGLPSSMIYIGVLSLAIYALVGHSVVL